MTALDRPNEITATTTGHHAINTPQHYDDAECEVITWIVAVIRVDWIVWDVESSWKYANWALQHKNMKIWIINKLNSKYRIPIIIQIKRYTQIVSIK